MAFEMQDIYLSKLDFEYFWQLRKYGTILLIFCTQEYYEEERDEPEKISKRDQEANFADF